jgi:hypothetical protein
MYLTFYQVRKVENMEVNANHQEDWNMERHSMCHSCPTPTFCIMGPLKAMFVWLSSGRTGSWSCTGHTRNRPRRWYLVVLSGLFNVLVLLLLIRAGSDRSGEELLMLGMIRIMLEDSGEGEVPLDEGEALLLSVVTMVALDSGVVGRDTAAGLRLTADATVAKIPTGDSVRRCCRDCFFPFRAPFS